MPAPFPLSVSEHVIRHLRLAIPVMLARAGLIIMISVDAIMAGRAGVGPLAHYAIALAPHILALVLGIGLLVGTVVLTAQADGAGRPADCGRVWFAALGMSCGLGLIAAIPLLWGEALLLGLGQESGLAAGGGRALHMFALGMPATLMYIATTFFLEAIGRPKVGMAIALSANLLNAGLNWLLITGEMGAPAMGAAGAALGTTITRWVMLFALVGYALTMRGAAGYGLRARPRGLGSLARKLLRLGAPLSIAAGLESSCFSAAATFAGWLGEAPLAAYQIAFGVVTFVFMLAIGLSNATSIRVANAVGRHDRAGMAAAGWTGVGLIAVLAAAIGLAIALFSAEITALYSRDAPVLALAEPLLAIVAVLVVVDGIQAVFLGALRATGDVIFPTLTYGLCFWALGVPAAYLLTFEAGAGVAGLIWGIFAALVCALLALGWRFSLVARHPVTPL